MFEIQRGSDGDTDLLEDGILFARWSCETKQIHVLRPDPQHTWDGRECTRAEGILILTALKAQLEKENGL